MYPLTKILSISTDLVQAIHDWGINVFLRSPAVSAASHSPKVGMAKLMGSHYTWALFPHQTGIMRGFGRCVWHLCMTPCVSVLWFRFVLLSFTLSFLCGCSVLFWETLRQTFSTYLDSWFSPQTSASKPCLRSSCNNHLSLPALQRNSGLECKNLERDIPMTLFSSII